MNKILCQNIVDPDDPDYLPSRCKNLATFQIGYGGNHASVSSCDECLLESLDHNTRFELTRILIVEEIKTLNTLKEMLLRGETDPASIATFNKEFDLFESTL